MIQHLRHGERPPGPFLAREPPHPHRDVPLVRVDVVQQRVEPRGLRVVRRRPARHRPHRRPAGESALQHPVPQLRIQVQAARRPQQGHRVPQPQRLVGAPGAVVQMRLHTGRLLDGTGVQRPHAQQRHQLLMGQPPVSLRTRCRAGTSAGALPPGALPRCRAPAHGGNRTGAGGRRPRRPPAARCRNPGRPGGARPAARLLLIAGLPASRPRGRHTRCSRRTSSG